MRNRFRSCTCTFIVLSCADVAPSEANREQRMREIVLRRKLVDTIKAQDEEYSILKMEVERLRMKTFPALVQVD